MRVVCAGSARFATAAKVGRRGYAWAQLAVAQRESDPTKKRALLEKSVAQGDACTMEALACVLRDGSEDELERTRGEALLLEAAHFGHADFGREAVWRR